MRRSRTKFTRSYLSLQLWFNENHAIYSNLFLFVTWVYLNEFHSARFRHDSDGVDEGFNEHFTLFRLTTIWWTTLVNWAPNGNDVSAIVKVQLNEKTAFRMHHDSCSDDNKRVSCISFNRISILLLPHRCNIFLSDYFVIVGIPFRLK